MLLTRLLSINYNKIYSCIHEIRYKLSSTVSKHAFFSRNFGRKCAANSKASPFEVETNVIRDVSLFKYENPKLHKTILFFAVSQCIFWNYLAHFAYTSLRDVKKNEAIKLGLDPDFVYVSNEDDPWWRRINLGENKYRNGITLLCVLIANGVIMGAWLHSSRSIRNLILLRGGKQVKLVTYSPLPQSKNITVPLNNISCNVSRGHITSSLPIKVKGYWLHFVLDKDGHFGNGKLFDYTAGIKRSWK